MNIINSIIYVVNNLIYLYVVQLFTSLLHTCTLIGLLVIGVNKGPLIRLVSSTLLALLTR